jgi:HTH-type transcriptional regulator / antitoxin HigA
VPDYAVQPGKILDETLSARNMKKSEFAERCQLSVKTISQIINEKAPITPETAI